MKKIALVNEKRKESMIPKIVDVPQMTENTPKIQENKKISS